MKWKDDIIAERGHGSLIHAFGPQLENAKTTSFHPVQDRKFDGYLM